MSLRCVQHPRTRLNLIQRLNNMEKKQDIINSFRKSRIVGEKLLSEGKITWEDYASTMVGFEIVLRDMGVNL